MSTKEKWAVYVIVIAVVAGLVWWYASPRSEERTEGTPGGPAAESTAGEVTEILPTAATDTSDAAISQDVAALDATMSNISSDSSSVDQSITASEQPAPNLTQ